MRCAQAALQARVSNPRMHCSSTVYKFAQPRTRGVVRERVQVKQTAAAQPRPRHLAAPPSWQMATSWAPLRQQEEWPQRPQTQPSDCSTPCTCASKCPDPCRMPATLQHGHPATPWLCGTLAHATGARRYPKTPHRLPGPGAATRQQLEAWRRNAVGGCAVPHARHSTGLWGAHTFCHAFAKSSHADST